MPRKGLWRSTLKKQKEQWNRRKSGELNLDLSLYLPYGKRKDRKNVSSRRRRRRRRSKDGKKRDEARKKGGRETEKKIDGESETAREG